MNKVVSVLKRYWNKIISAVCALGICAVTVFSMASPAYAVTSWADVSDDAISVRDAYFTYWFSHKSSFGDFIKQASDIPVSWLKFVDSFGWVISPVDDLYYYLNDSNDLMVAAGGGGGHSRTALHGGGGYCRTCRKPSDECTCEFFESEADGFDPVINGSDLKQIYTDYSLMYAPMPTPSQYLYSYQNVNGTRNGKSFYPYAPVYRYGRGWGCNVGQSFGWSEGCYLLGFLRDDDVGDTLYAECYQHFFFTKSDDGTVLFNYEVFSLTDGSLLYSGNTPYVSSGFYGLESANRLAIYLSDFKYLNNDNAGIAYYQFSYPRYNYYYSGKISQIVKTAFITYFNATTFTPQTNTADDWGYIMSETPFELFANQTSIDFSRLPNNYIITINGDTIYDYSITNPDSGDSTSIRKFIDIYDFPDVPDLPDPDDPDDPDTPGVNGNITVSGNVGVNGKIEIDTKPIDININVNSNGGSAPSGTAEAVDLSNYFSTLPEQSETMNDYLKNFFSFLPPQLLAVLLGGIGCAVLCRVLGR